MLPLETATFIAHWAALAAPESSRADARQAAWVGILQAAGRFDATRGAALETFVKRRARGAVYDFLRSGDRLSREHRKRVREGAVPAPVHIPCEEHPGVESHEAQVICRVTIEQLTRKANLTPRQHEAVRLTLAGKPANRHLLRAARRRMRMAA